MVEIGVNDVVVNEYRHTGKIVKIIGIEAQVAIYDYGKKNDIEYCDIKKCSLAGSRDINAAIEMGKETLQREKIIGDIMKNAKGVRVGVVRQALQEAISEF